jgi:hypothetical protein
MSVRRIPQRRADSRACALAGFGPPSKMGTSLTHSPGPTMRRTCSRPSGESLKIFTWPDWTPNMASAGSPSLKKSFPLPAWTSNMALRIRSKIRGSRS